MKIQRKTDGNFIIDYNGLPFGLPRDFNESIPAPDWLRKPKADEYEPGSVLTWELVKEYADAHPEDVSDYVEPQPKPLTHEQEIRNEISRIEWEYKTTRTIADAAMGNEWAINRLREAEELLKPLRAELATLSENQNK